MVCIFLLPSADECGITVPMDTPEALAKAISEIERLKRCLSYLSECNAATVECMPKSWSNREKRRFVSIVRTSADFLEGGRPKEAPFRVSVDDEVHSALLRCNQCLNKLKES